MYNIEIPYLNLRQIAESGQCFRWKRLDLNTAISEYGVPADIVYDIPDAHKSDNPAFCRDIYVIPPFGADQRSFSPLIMIDTGNGFLSSADSVDWSGHWSSYFDMSTDYEDIRRRIMESDDTHAKEAYAIGSGIRILKQDLWEMMVTFMISQNNNISRITGSIEKICEGHGGYFPRPEEFDIDMLDDRSIGLGYRAPYLKELIQRIRDDVDILNELSQMNYEDAYRTLTEYKGIGAKVANCICLFGLHHIGAFPIDTHVRQLLDRYYPNGFPYEYYSGVEGIIQQYLFYYELKNK